MDLLIEPPLWLSTEERGNLGEDQDIARRIINCLISSGNRNKLEEIAVFVENLRVTEQGSAMSVRDNPKTEHFRRHFEWKKSNAGEGLEKFREQDWIDDYWH